GALLAGDVPNHPFIAAAPSGWFRDVVMSQLSRIPAALRAPLTARAGALFGTGRLGVLAIVVLLAFAALVFAAFASRRRPTAFEWFALTSAVLVAAAQLVPAQYYQQYAAFLVPFL